jgi:lipopolysaccharide export system permease protein
MKNKIYRYFFSEFIRYFAVTLFALTSIIWTIQAVNFLDLVTDDGHAFKIYLFYSFLTIPKIITKLIPFSFLIASILTILKLEKDNELIILWTSGLNKIRIVNLIFYISLIIMFFQLLMSTFITPETLNISRKLLKNSELQFVSSLLKEKQFNDTLKGLTIFVDKKNYDGTYENIFIRDEGKLLTQVSAGSSTIIAKSGYVNENEKTLILFNGNIQRTETDKSVTIVKFEKTFLNLSGLSTKSISEPKIQETSTIQIIQCANQSKRSLRNCRNDDGTLGKVRNESKDLKIEINKRFGMPMFIPLISLVSCFLLSINQKKKNFIFRKYIFFLIGFIILMSSEITVRYSGISLKHTAIYYLIPLGLLPLVYLYLIRMFKYENLN